MKIIKIVKRLQDLLRYDGSNESHEVDKISIVQWIAKRVPNLVDQIRRIHKCV
jgi:hypothetical protein